MPCPSCGQELLGAFCSQCGAPAPVAPAVSPPQPRCVRCGAPVLGRFCNACGTPQDLAPPPMVPAYAPYAPYPYYPAYPPTAPSDGLRSLASIGWSLNLIVFSLAATISLATLLIVSSTQIVPGVLTMGPLDCGLGPCAAPLYVLLPAWPFIHLVARLADPALFLGYFVFLFVMILAAYLAHAWDARRLAATLRLPLSDFTGRFRTKSSWATVGQLWMATLFLQFALALLLNAPDDLPTSPSYPSWYGEYFLLQQASVHEELVTRVMFIGIPMAFVALALAAREGRGGVWKAFLKILGGGVDRDAPRPVLAMALFTLAFSSVLFGLAHVPAWGPWKFGPTLFAGLAMGYVFLRHGLAAAILFHFVNDYFVASILLVQDNLAGVLLLGLLLLVILAIGAVFFILYLVYSINLLTAVLRRLGVVAPRPEPVPQAYAPPVYAPPPFSLYPPPSYPPAYPPPYVYPGTYGPPPVAAAPPPPDPTRRPFFVCPRCASTSASYANGRFTCSKCGTIV